MCMKWIGAACKQSVVLVLCSKALHFNAQLSHISFRAMQGCVHISDTFSTTSCHLGGGEPAKLTGNEIGLAGFLRPLGRKAAGIDLTRERQCSLTHVTVLCTCQMQSTAEPSLSACAKLHITGMIKASVNLQPDCASQILRPAA